MHAETKRLIRDAETELVFGLVAPVGADLDAFEQLMRDKLGLFEYQPAVIRLSAFLKEAGGLAMELGIPLLDSPEKDRIRTYMDAGNRLRQQLGVNEVLALWAVARIMQQRREDAPRRPRTAYVLRSIKHPDEARALRAVYGQGFFLIGLAVPDPEKVNYLVKRKAMSPDDAEALISRDRGEENEFGQHTRDAFELADVFIAQGNDHKKTEQELERFLDLVFGAVAVTPTRDEHAMFLAYASSLRSGDLSRQVGAILWHPDVGVVGSGCNDVPCAQGGLYWPDEKDQRDLVLGFDANESHREAITDEVATSVARILDLDSPEAKAKIREACRNTRLLDITEFGRAVHAEMDALLSAARAGVPTRGTMLFTTTYPCHNCAKHIIAAGVTRVIYIEPYEKSQAPKLHGDAITAKRMDDEDPKVLFESFVGVGPRRYFDLFSMKLSDGYPLKRKTDGKLALWQRPGAHARVPMLPTSYLEREKLLANELGALLKERT